MQKIALAPFGELLATFRARRRLTQAALATALGTHRNTIGRWERGEVLPDTRGIVLELAKHLHLDDQDARLLLDASLTSPAFFWTVPFARNPCFTGREEMLERLHMLLTTAQPVQAAALSGLGGIGKTQVAVEYAYRYALEYHAVFWLAAETLESLMGSFQQIADQVQLAQSQAAEQSQMVAAVQQWLATHPGWLLIGDNVEDLDLLQAVLPPKRPGALLLTTRRQALGTLAEPLQLPPMSHEEGVTLLLRRIRRPGVLTPDLPRPLDASIPPAASALVTALEGLPLALDQAGAYIEETGCRLEDYLQRYSHQRKLVLLRRGLHGGAHPTSVATTLKLAIERVEQEAPAAGELLRLCAFLHAEAIPEELVGAGSALLGPVLAPLVADPYQFDLALAALRNASLVTRAPDTHTIALHRLVQAVLQDEMEPGEVRMWSERVVRLVNASFPDGTFGTWTQCERYLAQALACVPLLEQATGAQPEAGELFTKAGTYLCGRSRYAEAQALLEQAVALGEQVYGTDHPALLPRLEQQAKLCGELEQFERAEALLRRVLALGEHHLGPEHLQITRSLTDLALLHQVQGRYTGAEQMCQRALSMLQTLQEKPESDGTALTLNDLGLLSYQQALAIWEQVLGPEHPTTAFALTHLARCARDQGQMEQAEALYQRALRVREEWLSPGHSYTAISLINLANLYRDSGCYEQAEPLYQRALAIGEQRLGPEHPGVVGMRQDYHVLLQNRAKAAAATDEKL